jgi:hypothetical protein
VQVTTKPVVLYTSFLKATILPLELENEYLKALITVPEPQDVGTINEPTKVPDASLYAD